MRFFKKPKPAPAVRASMRAKVVHGAHHLLGHTYDVSDTTAHLLVNPAGVRVGDSVQIELLSIDARALWITGRVTSTAPEGKPRGVSVAFVGASRATVESLRQFVATTRRHQRITIALPVLLQCPDRVMDAVTHDVSIGGCYACCDGASLSLGDKLVVALKLEPGAALSLEAEIVWKRDSATHGKPAGVALKFIGVTEQQQARIAARITPAQAAA